jgi:hypothetical protein
MSNNILHTIIKCKNPNPLLNVLYVNVFIFVKIEMNVQINRLCNRYRISFYCFINYDLNFEIRKIQTLANYVAIYWVGM